MGRGYGTVCAVKYCIPPVMDWRRQGLGPGTVIPRRHNKGRKAGSAGMSTPLAKYWMTGKPGIESKSLLCGHTGLRRVNRAVQRMQVRCALQSGPSRLWCGLAM